MSWPLVVTKFVRTTQTGMPYFYRNDSNLAIFFLSFTCTIVVPSKMNALLSIYKEGLAIFSKESAFLTIGTD